MKITARKGSACDFHRNAGFLQCLTPAGLGHERKRALRRLKNAEDEFAVDPGSMGPGPYSWVRKRTIVPRSRLNPLLQEDLYVHMTSPSPINFLRKPAEKNIGIAGEFSYPQVIKLQPYRAMPREDRRNVVGPPATTLLGRRGRQATRSWVGPLASIGFQA